MRILPCRPSSSMTHFETVVGVISSTNCGVGGTVRFVALADCTNSFSFLNSKCKAFDVGLIPVPARRLQLQPTAALESGRARAASFSSAPNPPLFHTEQLLMA